MIHPAEVVAVNIPHTPRAGTLAGWSNPLAWKEQRFGKWSLFDPNLEVFTIWIVLFTLALPLLVWALVLAMVVGPDLSVLLAFFVVLPGLGAVVMIGLRAASSVATERQRGTLDSLRVLPIERRAIIEAKATAAVRTGWIAAALSLLIGIAGVLRGSFALPAAIGIPISLLGWISAATGFGLWLSVCCPTRERAIGWFLGLGLSTSIILPMLGSVLSHSPTELTESFVGAVLEGLSPVTGLWNATPTIRSWDRDEDWTEIAGATVGGVIAGLAGLLFLWRATRRFERNE